VLLHDGLLVGGDHQGLGGELLGAGARDGRGEGHRHARWGLLQHTGRGLVHASLAEPNLQPAAYIH